MAIHFSHQFNTSTPYISTIKPKSNGPSIASLRSHSVPLPSSSSFLGAQQLHPNLLFGARWNERCLGQLDDTELYQLMQTITDTNVVFTPTDIVDRMIEYAEINNNGLRVLEPSGGSGNIATKLAYHSKRVDVVEPLPVLREILKRKSHAKTGHFLGTQFGRTKAYGGKHYQGFNLLDIQDFTQYRPGTIYDRIVMNPPYNGQQLEHIKRGVSLLKKDGILVAIIPAYTFYDVNPSKLNQKVHGQEFTWQDYADFQEWISHYDYELCEEVPGQTFIRETADGTQSLEDPVRIKTVILKIKK